MNNNPFIMKTFIDDRVYLQEESISKPKEFKKIIFKEKSKKDPKIIPLPDDIQMLIPNGKKEVTDDINIEDDEDNSKNTENITEIVEEFDNIESNGELPENLFGGNSLSSEEKNNIKNIHVNTSFF